MDDILDNQAPFDAVDRLHQETVLDQHAEYHRQFRDGALPDALWARLDLFFRKFVAEQAIGPVWAATKASQEPAFVDYVEACLAGTQATARDKATSATGKI